MAKIGVSEPTMSRFADAETFLPKIAVPETALARFDGTETFFAYGMHTQIIRYHMSWKYAFFHTRKMHISSGKVSVSKKPDIWGSQKPGREGFYIESICHPSF